MPKPNLIQYSPSPEFQRLLAKYGISLNTPHHLKPIPNPDAENILPRTKRSSWIHRLSSFFLIMGITVFPTYARSTELHISGEVAFADIFLALILFHSLCFIGLLIVLIVQIRKLIDGISKSHEPVTNNGETPPEDKISPYPKRPYSVIVGGATRKGLIREENQDAFRVESLINGEGLLVVCDGVGGHPGGREAAQFASKYLIQFLGCRLQSQAPSQNELQMALQATQNAFSTHEIEGLSTAIVALIASNTIYYATLGDGDLVIIHPDGMTQSLLAPHHARDLPENVITAHLSRHERFIARTGAVQLESGAQVLAMTDGVSELLDIDQIALNRQAYIEAFKTQNMDQVANHILKNIEQARDDETDALLHSDNMTLAIALVEKENTHETC